MTARRPTARHMRRDSQVSARYEPSQRMLEQRAHQLRALTRTAIASAVLGGIFLLTASDELHQMAIFLFAWSGGWTLASLSLRIQGLVRHGRRSDKR